MTIDKEQKVEAYKRLSEKEKDFLTSEKFSDTLKNLGTRHGLLLDKIGVLGDAILVMLLGLIKSNELHSELAGLNIDERRLEALLTDINKEIILPFRALLASETPTDETNETEQTVAPELDRASVLDEIENPTPAEHPITVHETPEAVAHDFIGGKLTETVNLPPQKTVVESKPAPQKPKYTVDPYREPLQ